METPVQELPKTPAELALWASFGEDVYGSVPEATAKETLGDVEDVLCTE